MRVRLGLLVALLLVAAGAAPARAQDAGPDGSRTALRVVVPDPDNLQYLSFWVALGAGYFDTEGFEVQISSPSFPAGVNELLRREAAPVAVLPPPVYLELIADKFPIRLVANLLTNDGINLVVRRSVLEERHLSPTAPLGDRLRGMKGLKVGIAPGPVTRLRKLFASEGLVADEQVDLAVMPGQDENDAFGKHRVDALYAHTPYLEKALVDQDGAILVNQSAGEVPSLSGLQIHVLCVTASFAEEHADSVVGLARAVQRAQTLLHTDRAAATAAVLHALPKLEPRLVEPIVRIYEPAVPTGPQVSVERLAPALALFPARKSQPSFEGLDLATYVAPRFAEQVARDAAAAAVTRTPPARPISRTGIGAALAVLAAALVGVLVMLRRRR